MKFPLWSEVKEKISSFQKEIEDFRKKNPVISSTIETTISFLPPPLNTIAEKIYSSTEGTPEDKIEAVIIYLDKIQSQGEQHYRDITSKLNEVLGGIDDIKALGAKESTLQTIQDILITNNERATEMLGDLAQQLDKMDIKLETIDSKLDVIVQVMRTTGTLNQIVQDENQPGAIPQSPHSQVTVVAERQENVINLKIGNNIIETIEKNNLANLSEADRRALSEYEDIMLTY